MKDVAVLSKKSLDQHSSLKGSVLVPVAPEWSTGEDLLGSLYRLLILGVAESAVDREEIEYLPDRLSRVSKPSSEAWGALLHQTEPTVALAHPASREAKLGLRNVIPLVPELARYGCVKGNPRNRWNPSNLFCSALASGAGVSNAKIRIGEIKEALEVGDNEDIFASYIESELQKLQELDKRDGSMSLKFYSPLYRKDAKRGVLRSPSEQMYRDLGIVLKLKGRLTRRQWIVLVEALLRLSLSTHILWLLRVGAKFWKFAYRAVDRGENFDVAAVEEALWEKTMSEGPPLIALAAEWNPQMSKIFREYGEARLGLSALFTLLDDVNHAWPQSHPLGRTDAGEAPISEMAKFLKYCVDHRADLLKEVKKYGHDTLESLASAIADENNSYVRRKSRAPKRLYEFVMYTCQQASTKNDDQMGYDQSYLCVKKGKRRQGRYVARLGPNLLILLVHACCENQTKGIPASLDDLRSHLQSYGIRGSLADLQPGSIGAELERLGLVVDSPDAGGGRLLVNPF